MLLRLMCIASLSQTEGIMSWQTSWGSYNLFSPTFVSVPRALGAGIVDVDGAEHLMVSCSLHFG